MSASMEEGDEIEMSVDGESVVHIVSVDGSKGKEPEASYIRALASIIDGEETSKEALIYHYKHVASGFSPKLTVK